MKAAIQQFQLNVQGVRSLEMVCHFVDNQAQNIPALSIDTSEVLRAEVVQIVSALDCFIHNIVRLGMIDCYKGLRAKGNAYDGFPISMSIHENVLNTTDSKDREAIIDNEIRRINGYKPFQEPEKISHALAVIGVERIWEKTGRDLSMTAKEVKDRLDGITKWRNRIAHEADIDGTYGFAGIKHNISQTDVKSAVDFIEKLCESIAQNV